MEKEIAVDVGVMAEAMRLALDLVPRPEITSDEEMTVYRAKLMLAQSEGIAEGVNRLIGPIIEAALRLATKASDEATAVGNLLEILNGQLTTDQLYADLTSRIALIDDPATGLVLSVATIAAQIDVINAGIAGLSGTQPYDNARTYPIAEAVTYLGGLYVSTAITVGHLPTDISYWKKVGDYASLNDAVAAHSVALIDQSAKIDTVDGRVTAVATNVTALQTAVAGNTSSITGEATARATADSAEATLRTALASRVTTAETNITASAAAIVTEATTRTTADSALSSRIDTVSAATGTNLSAIQTEVTARTNADTAIASNVTTLQSTVSGHTTSIQAQQTTVDGLSAKYTVKIDNNGYVSGFGLASTANNGVPTSEFMIAADKFSIAPVATAPGAADGSPFYYLTVPTVVNGVTIPAGAYMKAAFIADASVGTLTIAGNAVTVAVDTIFDNIPSLGAAIYAWKTIYFTVDGLTVNRPIFFSFYGEASQSGTFFQINIFDPSDVRLKLFHAPVSIVSGISGYPANFSNGFVPTSQGTYRFVIVAYSSVGSALSNGNLFTQVSKR